MKNLFFTFLVLLALSFCSRITDSMENGRITITAGSNSIVIYNGTMHRIYYFAVESNTAALIDWCPSLEWPSIKSGRSDSTMFNQIIGGKEIPLEEGDRIIVYWWNKYHYDNGEINSTDIVL